MGDRCPIPTISGALTGLVGADGIRVAYFDAANVLTRVSLVALEAPSGGTTVAQLNTAADGSGSGISVTIADGENFGTAAGSVALAAGSYLYLLVTSDAGGALGLGGSYDVERTSGVTTYLTSLAAVKLDGKITSVDADRDALLNAIIAGVTKRIQNEIEREIVQGTETGERLDSIGDEFVFTYHYPIISIAALAENGAALVEDTDFELTAADRRGGRIRRLISGLPGNWASGYGVVQLTYTHGYAAVPDDLARAATAQVLQDYNEAPRGKGWRGLVTEGTDPTASVTYDKEFWEKQTLPVLNRYRRLA